MNRTLVCCALAFACASAACTGKYKRAVTDEKVERTPARLARGDYLVNQLSGCGGCHTSRETGTLLAESERADKFLAGGNWLPDAVAPIFIPNITQDTETGLGAWSDDEIMRSIRDGIHKDGHILLPMMPSNQFQHYSDEDIRSIVAYLRTVPPVKQPRMGETKLPFMPNLLFRTIGVHLHAPVGKVPDPDKKNADAYGLYVARIGACTDCHSLTDKGPRKEDDPLFMAGSENPFSDPKLGKVWARNLTPDPETGLGKYSAEQIKQAIRTATTLDGHKMAPPMSIMMAHYSGITDEDLDALIHWLKTLKPVKRLVPPRELTPAMQAAYP